MAEIRVARPRRKSTFVLALLAVIIVAVVAWYFLLGPGSVAAGGV